MTKHSIGEELRGIVAFVGAVWGVFLLSLIIPLSLNSLGVTPRSIFGLSGILFMPFLHADFGHLLSNTIPLIVLLLLLAGSRANSAAIVAGIVLLGGALLWLFGRPMTHIGASSLVYGLSTFLLVSGFLERRIIPLTIAIFVAFVFGGTLLSGVVPKLGSHISWDGHLWGGVAGGIVAVLLTKGSD